MYQYSIKMLRTSKLYSENVTYFCNVFYQCWKIIFC